MCTSPDPTNSMEYGQVQTTFGSHDGSKRDYVCSIFYSLTLCVPDKKADSAGVLCLAQQAQKKKKKENVAKLSKRDYLCPNVPCRFVAGSAEIFCSSIQMEYCDGVPEWNPNVV